MPHKETFRTHNIGMRAISIGVDDASLYTPGLAPGVCSWSVSLLGNFYVYITSNFSQRGLFLDNIKDGDVAC